MIYDSIIIRSGEMFLKTGHQAQFEGKLVYNLKAMAGLHLVIKTRGRFIVPYFSQHQALPRIFGISSYSLALRAEKTLDAIQEAVAKLLSEKAAATFKIETTRADKTFPLDSKAVNKVVGQHIEKTSKWQCDFHQPEILVQIEINRKGAYIFTDTIPGAGGLPVGTAGKISARIENEADILAGILMMKRGCTIFPLLVGEEKDLSRLQQFSPTKLKMKQFATEEELVSYLQQRQISVVVSGETLEDGKKDLPGVAVFRPLIGYTNKSVENEWKKFNQIVE